jgi:hypothetical protein
MNEILKIPFAAFNNDWESLQIFLGRRGYPHYEITDNLDLRGINIESLGNLTSVEGDLFLGYSGIKSLGNLTSVGGGLFLGYTGIKSLGNLTSVGGWLDLWSSEIECLGNLTSVGGTMDLRRTKQLKTLGNLTSVGGYLNLGSTPLTEKYTKNEIQSMVKVGCILYY